MKALILRVFLITSFSLFSFSSKTQLTQSDLMAIDSCLQLLSAGLIDISVDQSVAALYYAQLGYCVDKYYRLGYNELIEKYYIQYDYDIRS